MIRQRLTKTIPASVVIAALAGTTSISAEEREAVDALLDCTILLASQRKGDEHTLQQLAYMVQTAITEEVSESAVITYVNQCRTLEETLKDMPQVSKKEYLGWIENLPNPKSTKKVFSGFVSPNHECKIAGAHTGLSFLPRGIVGGNIGIDLAYCESSLGHTWVEIRPYMEATTGISFESANIGKQLRWGFHGGAEQGKTAMPAKSPYNIDAHASVDLQAFVGVHLSTLMYGKPQVTSYHGGLTFSLTPAATFGLGAGSNFRFGLESGKYDHLKRSVLEPSIHNLTFF